MQKVVEEGHRVVSLGWYGHQNCGDETFRAALRVLFPKVDFIFINNLAKHVDLVNSSDYLLIGGGNIVTGDFLNGLDDVTSPYSFVGVGLTPNAPVRYLEGAEWVLVRDLISQRLYRSSYYMPDLAFSLTPNRDVGRVILEQTPHFDPKRKTVGVFLNDCVSTNFYGTILKFIEAEKVKLELSRFLADLPYNVVFVPMSLTPPDDRRISFDVIGKMTKGYKYTCLTEPLRPRDCLSLIAALDYGITMRLHASIFCTMAGVPFMDLLHHDKSRGYLETNGLEDLGLNYYELSLRTLEDKFAYIEKEYTLLSKTLLKTANENKQQLSEVLKNVHLPQRR
jgi:polysaccharide pyruvyl transferase WcaK-like protein